MEGGGWRVEGGGWRVESRESGVEGWLRMAGHGGTGCHCTVLDLRASTWQKCGAVPRRARI